MFHFDEFLKRLNETFWMIFKHGEEEFLKIMENSLFG